MGYDLYNSKKHYVRFNVRAWPLLLELAFHYGWNRTGINYLSNDVIVTKEDAENIASALEKALPDLPDIRVYKEPHIYPKHIVEMIMNPETSEEEKEFLQNMDFIISSNETIVPEDSINKVLEKMNPPKGQEVVELLRFFSGDYNKWHIQKFVDFCRSDDGFEIQ